MKAIESAQLVHQLEWRYSSKIFDAGKKISPEDWRALERALVLTSSSYGLQPWKFIVVTDEATRKKLTSLSWNQKQVESCSHYIVIAHRTTVDEPYIVDHMQTISDTRGTPIEKLDGYKKNILGDLLHGSRSKNVPEWAARQCYIALGNFITAAAMLGIDTCPMEGLDPAGYDKVLGLENSSYKTLVACAAGYRSPEDKLQHQKKVRFSTEKVVMHI